MPELVFDISELNNRWNRLALIESRKEHDHSRRADRDAQSHESRKDDSNERSNVPAKNESD
jgi:hypothetical protein